jgi:hypothetical protein
MTPRTTIPAEVIRPEELETLRQRERDYLVVLRDLDAEVVRLRAEVDRLTKLGGTQALAPLASKADHTHPLFPLWVELNLDNMPGLLTAWETVQEHRCPKCGAELEDFMDGNACHDCGLLWILYTAGKHGSLAIDTIERAQERGPDE